MVNFALGMASGIVLPLVAFAGAARYFTKHPEHIVKAMSRKMVREMRKDKSGQPS